MIKVNGRISLGDEEIEERFVRASGPGGQNVNKLATAVELRFDVKNSPSLPEEVRVRLLHLLGNRVNKEGVLIIKAQRFRTQERNREDAVEKLIEWIRDAAIRPLIRKKTKPTYASKVKRLERKSKHSAIKNLRRRQIERE